MNELKMRKKRVLVTGAGTGIGQEIALEFAKQGASVAVHYAHSEKGATTLVKEITKLDRKVKAFKTDMASIDQINTLSRQAVDFLGGLDVLVNNAGITMNIPFENVTPEQFDLLYQVNVRGQFFLTQKTLSDLITSHGVIINITSIHAFQGYTDHSVYAGTKGAIVAYTRQLAIELAPKGVRVNAIAPGAIPAEKHFRFSPDVSSKSAIKEFGKKIPCGFAGNPLDIAKVAVFLATDDARYIVGQTLIVDGGTTAWMPFGEGYKEHVKSQFGTGYVPGL
ncbi:MAG: SDR family oxidoreductase [Spirochaetota bacterium]